MSTFPEYRQHDNMDCGAACVKIIAAYYGKSYTLSELKKICIPTREGISMAAISQTLEDMGFRCVGGRITTEILEQKSPLPCILHWSQNHFVVLYKIHDGKFYISDPGVGLISYSKEEFEEKWVTTKTDKQDKGVALLIHKQGELKDLSKAKDKGSLKILIP